MLSVLAACGLRSHSVTTALLALSARLARPSTVCSSIPSALATAWMAMSAACIQALLGLMSSHCPFLYVFQTICWMSFGTIPQCLAHMSSSGLTMAVQRWAWQWCVAVSCATGLWL